LAWALLLLLLWLLWVVVVPRCSLSARHGAVWDTARGLLLSTARLGLLRLLLLLPWPVALLLWYLPACWLPVTGPGLCRCSGGTWHEPVLQQVSDASCEARLNGCCNLLWGHGSISSSVSCCLLLLLLLVEWQRLCVMHLFIISSRCCCDRDCRHCCSSTCCCGCCCKGLSCNACELLTLLALLLQLDAGFDL
jgi:hypothetical protein